MNAPTQPLLLEVLLGPRPADQPNLELASEGVQRYVWQGAYGAMLIGGARRCRLRQRQAGDVDGGAARLYRVNVLLRTASAQCALRAT